MAGFKLGSRTTTLLLSAPPYLVGALVAFGVAYSSGYHGERGWHIAAPMAAAAVGFIISASILNIPIRYAASFLYVSSVLAAMSVVYSWAATTLNQTPEKRACAVAIVNMIGQLGSVWSPFFFPGSHSPRYVMAMLLMFGFSVLSMACAMTMKGILKRANKLMRQNAEQTGERVTCFVE
jgi:hypothetical protein